jgi:hypothetical protein
VLELAVKTVQPFASIGRPDDETVCARVELAVTIQSEHASEIKAAKKAARPWITINRQRVGKNRQQTLLA